MADYRLLLSSDINTAEMYKHIANVLQQRRTLFLTATQNLKRIRLQHLEETELLTIKTFSELKEQVYSQIKEGPSFLSRADQKFVLTQVIKKMFSGERQNALYKMRNELFTLYEFLISEEVSEIPEEILSQIERDYTINEKDIFAIYNRYYDSLWQIKQGKIPDSIDLVREKQGKPVKLLSEIINHNLFSLIDEYENIVFDGFLFFNDEQKKVILDAILKNKNILFIAKNMKVDNDNFLLNQLFKPLENEFNIKLNITHIAANTAERPSAITYVKNNYLNFRSKPDVTIDNGFKFIEPFASRDRELNYIINCISKYLKEKCKDDRNEICKMLANDIAIVIANDKEKYEQQLNVLLKERGVFFLDRDSEILSTFYDKNLKDVIYTRNEFLESKIKNAEGEYLTRQEKIVAFKKLYKGINISQKSRSFINYPIGQYILEIYKIINQGMSCEGFKKILYSNWYYNVGLDTVKYDKYINEFRYIEPYLAKKKTPKQWIDEIKELKKQKEIIANSSEYRFHPLKDISESSIDFLINQVSDVKIMVDSLSRVYGDINEHLKALNQNFLIDEIINNKNISNEFEIEVIKHLKEIIDSINKSNLITNIDSKYFSDNIKNMLMDYEREKAESSADELTLNVVNLENMQNFKLVFFCMLEDDKYPRQFKMNFPFNKNIIEILENPKYEIERKPSFLKTLDYHLKLEKYLFLNVLDFTKGQMIITQTEEENGKELTNSIYIEDIFSIFQLDIKYQKLKESYGKTDVDYNPIKKIEMPYRDSDSIKLSDFCSYFLCPKIYYYLTNPKLKNEISYESEWKLNIYVPALIFYKTMYKLGMYGKQSKVVYSVNDLSFIEEIQKCLDESLKEELPHFDFLTKFNIKDIKTRATNLISQFVNRNIIKKDIPFFSFDLSNAEIIKLINKKGKEFNVEIDSCLLVKDATSGLYLNYDISSQIDFLVKSSGGETYPLLQHFDDILNQLKQNNPLDDRMALISFMFFKLNVQLNSRRFRADGYDRMKKLANEIVSQTDENYVPSSYCRYCKFESVCKMKERGSV